MQDKVKKEVEKIKNGASKKNISQLNSILDDLIKIEKEKQLSVSFPRFIIDSWDYQDELGVELLDLMELYKKWK